MGTVSCSPLLAALIFSKNVTAIFAHLGPQARKVTAQGEALGK
jgi:hypothetical protein